VNEVCNTPSFTKDARKLFALDHLKSRSLTLQAPVIEKPRVTDPEPTDDSSSAVDSERCSFVNPLFVQVQIKRDRSSRADENGVEPRREGMVCREVRMTTAPY
jgi:hypothetical protein